jgi:hypothetical protein
MYHLLILVLTNAVKELVTRNMADSGMTLMETDGGNDSKNIRYNYINILHE